MISAGNAVSAYLRATQAATPQPQSETGFSQAAQSFEKLMAAADTDAVGAMSGTTETHQLVQSLSEAELALDTAVAIRDKVVEAYQEILRMPA